MKESFNDAHGGTKCELRCLVATSAPSFWQERVAITMRSIRYSVRRLLFFVFARSIDAVECNEGVIDFLVSNDVEATKLAMALTCSGSAHFEVAWHGTVEVGLPMAVSNKSILTITGLDEAIIKGTERFQLFSLSGGAELNLNNISLHGGWAADGGGAISASETSYVGLHDCSVSDNSATNDGGEEDYITIGSSPHILCWVLRIAG